MRTFVAWVFFVLMVLFYGFGLGGCAVVYPGDGTVVYVRAEGAWTPEQRAALDDGCRVWNEMGAELRTDVPWAFRTLPVSLDGIPGYAGAPPDTAGIYITDLGQLHVDVGVAEKFGVRLSTVLAHELGHAIGLAHDERGIMNAHSPTDDLSDLDVDEYLAKWGRR